MYKNNCKLQVYNVSLYVVLKLPRKVLGLDKYRSSSMVTHDINRSTIVPNCKFLEFLLLKYSTTLLPHEK